MKTAVILALLLLLLTGCGTHSTQEPPQNGEKVTEAAEKIPENSQGEDRSMQNGQHGGQKGRRGGMDKSGDAELSEMIAALVPNFSQETYTDADTGLTVPYNLFLPQNYDPSARYPLVVFIGDMTTAGADMKYSLTQGWGGLIWASREEQEKHPCIVAVPVYPVTILDDRSGYTMTDYVELTPRLIRSITENYAVDMGRIYGTGQSMGAMTTLYLAANHPDLYAAVLIVDGQWDISTLSGLKTQQVIYIVAGGDESASNGQREVKAMLDQDDIPYSEMSGLDAQAARSELDNAVNAMLQERNTLNFLTWEAGTVLGGVAGGSTAEHMASFDYAYKLESVRDWLFAQSK